ncbi:hypothetical protein IW261DRAFT_1427517 [Armillaria novae-zelandiae]|uniref:Uncharacterized protein n=1 Tax=Armillaria novae-zelandiae TaxID=153914 RepID=A0AA39NEG3_9AGAR|nr:hypothetical protein IW261DRAFT_1427517 [Armillaria novae-zelandiae]
MEASSLTNTLERMPMEDIIMALKELQLKNQSLQEENCGLLTNPSIPNTTSSPVLSPGNSAAADASGSANDSLYKIMKDVGGLQQLNFLNRFRTLAPDIFDGIVLREYFRKSFDCHKDPLCQHLLGFKSAGVYNRYPPCLFADGFTSGTTIFRTIYGVKILTCLLWGSMALDDQHIITKGTYANLWHINEVNSVAITFAAVVMCYLLTGDVEFATDQLKKGMTSMHATVKFYNDHIFPTDQDRRYQVPTTISTSLNEEEENFWHELEVIDKEPNFDPEGFDPTPPITPVISVHNTPPAVSHQVDLPAISVTNDLEAHLGVADANNNVQSRVKGTRGKKASKAVPAVTRVTCSRGGQSGVSMEAEAPIAWVM